MTDTNTTVKFESDSYFDAAFNAHAEAIAERAAQLIDDKRWTFEVWNTGGGILCIAANHPLLGTMSDAPDQRSTIWFGTASGTWGWSDDHGEQFGEAGYSADMRFLMASRAPSWDAHSSDVAEAIVYTLNSWEFSFEDPAVGHATYRVSGHIEFTVAGDDELTDIVFLTADGSIDSVLSFVDGDDGRRTLEEAENILSRFLDRNETDGAHPIRWEG